MIKMRINKNVRLATLVLLITCSLSAQKSNIQTYTPSKLLKKDQVDFKWFNNFYSETKSTFVEGKQPRINFYTSTFEFFRGINENSRLNIGVVVNLKSNNIGGQNWFSPLNLKQETGTSRVGISSIAPSISFQPFSEIGNFSIRSSIFIPIFSNEKERGVFLDKKSYVWENKIFYDYTFPSGDFQIFTSLDTQLNLGESYFENPEFTSVGGFANNSLGLPASVFVSYFPNSNSTLFLQAQQYFLVDLGNDFSQEYTQLGIGAKYQITSKINIETSYTNFVRGTDTGLGETINFGLRFLSN